MKATELAGCNIAPGYSRWSSFRLKRQQFEGSTLLRHLWGAGRLCQVQSCPPRIVQTLPQHPCKTTNIHNFLPDLSSTPGCRAWIVFFLLPWLSTMPKSSGPYIIMDEMSKGVPLLLYKLVSTLRKLPLLLGSTLSRSIDTWISRSGRECSWTAPGSRKANISNL